MFQKISLVTVILPLLLWGTNGVAQDTWTTMHYICADNNLNNYANPDCDEMEANGGNANYNIIIQIDGNSTGYKDAAGTNSDTRRYVISAGNTSDNKINSSPASGSPNTELDMGDGNVLRDFGRWGVKNYPANRYCLNLWNHGNSMTRSELTKDCCNDDGSSSSIRFADTEPPAEYETALMGIKDSLKQNLDVLTFDACVMALAEIMFIAKDYAHIQVSSEKSIGADGYRYDTWLDTLKKNNSVSDSGLAIACVRSYKDEYTNTDYNTLSAIHLKTRFMEFIKALDNFARELILAGGRTQTDISDARSNTEAYDNADQVDLWDFAIHIEQKTGLPASLRNAADTLRAKIGYDKSATWHSNGQGILVAETHISNRTATDSAHGVSIYYRKSLNSDTTIYKRHQMSKATLWDEFICGRTSSQLTNITALSYERYQKNASGTYWKVDDGASGNGYPDVNESCTFYPVLRNSGGKTATGVSVKLRLKKNILGGITLTDTTAAFSDIAGATKNVKAPTVAVANDPLGFSVANNSTLNGEWIDFDLVITSSEGTKSVSFPMQIGRANPLAPTAVEFSEFALTTGDDGIVLEWRTESEINIYSWEIEKTTNYTNENTEWTRIATIPSKGNSSIPTEYSYTDRDVKSGMTYYYRLVEIDIEGSRTIREVGSATFLGNIPKVFALYPAYPNPSGGAATIRYDIPKKSFVSLKIYNIAGQLVKTLVGQTSLSDITPGVHRVRWDGRDESGKQVADGVYFYRLQAGNFTDTKKMILVR
ncbi:MAG: clostripain-related cysteine peptidase [Candidatus Edwardsbacteria bacterium]